MRKRILALLAALGATTIYGLNHTVAKGIMPEHLSPFAFIFLRVIGGFVFFWAATWFAPKERIDRADFKNIFLAAVFGACINMLSFFSGLELSTPINSALIVTTTPITTLVLSVIFLKEEVTKLKTSGIALGFLGALSLILLGQEVRSDAPNPTLGNALIMLNSISYSIYLIIVRNLMQKYNAFTILKWIFTFSLLLNTPITLNDFMAIDWPGIPLWGYGTIAFVVIGVTCMTFLLNAYAMSELKASTIGVFSYVQPVIAIVFAVIAGKDRFTATKIAAATLVFTGVFMATRKKAKPKEVS